jgi:hypothetical protein
LDFILSWKENSWSEHFDERDFVAEVTKITRHLIHVRYRGFKQWEFDELLSSVLVHVLNFKFNPEKGATASTWLYNCVVFALKRISEYETHKRRKFNRRLLSEAVCREGEEQFSAYDRALISSNDLWTDPYSITSCRKKRSVQGKRKHRKTYTMFAGSRIYSHKFGLLWESNEAAREALCCSQQTLSLIVKQRKPTKKYGRFELVDDTFVAPKRTEEQLWLWKKSQATFQREKSLRVRLGHNGKAIIVDGKRFGSIRQATKETGKRYKDIIKECAKANGSCQFVSESSS